MKAIILNSGIGKRMGELTKDKPKCLVDIGGGETILSHQVKFLADHHVTDIIITTGPFPEKIKNHLKSRFAGSSLKFTYVPNPLYETTNYIYSLHLTANLFSGDAEEDGDDDDHDEDILLMHGDLVFDAAVPAKLIRAAHNNAVLVDREAELPEKDFKCRLQDNLVQEIGVNLFGPDCRFLVPMYKLSAKTYKKWLAEIATFVEHGKTSVYAEDALNKLLKENIKLHPVYYSEEFCSEIDDTEDLKHTKKNLKPPPHTNRTLPLDGGGQGGGEPL